jgi:GT2 family glycosyltransferase
MSELRGSIDLLENGVVSGWVISDQTADVEFFCGENRLGTVGDLVYRQDVFDALSAEGNTGFNFDVSSLITELTGSHSFSIRLDGELIAEKEFYLTSGNNLVLNPFVELSDIFSLKEATIFTNHRIGTNLQRFIAPSSLKHSNGEYTRLSFGDSTNTKLVFEMALNLDQSAEDSSRDYPLQFVLVAKSSHMCNLHIRWLDDADNCVWDEPIQIDQDWSLKSFSLNEFLSKKVRLGELRLVLRTKHYGRRTIDIAMVALTEDIDKCKTPIQEMLEEAQTEDSAYTGNVLNNGELTQWSKGIDFSTLKRGQELADNWFVEMTNANIAHIQAVVAADNSGQDPLAKNLQTSFGLRMRTGDLQGYARVVSPINVEFLNVVNYELVLDVESSGLDKRAVLPRLYFIARNAYDDIVVMDVARKVTIKGRQSLVFNLSAYQIDELLSRAKQMPVIVFAIDLPLASNFTIYSATLRASDSQTKKKVEVPKVSSEQLYFEDGSITEQLHLLKGLSSWKTGEGVSILPKPILEAESTLYQRNEFEQLIFKLTPHKMARPSRGFPFIDIIIPVYNACDDVLLCLSSLIEKTDLAHRIIIVNDGDERRTAEMLAAFDSSFNHLNILDNPVNIGYTKSVNLGIKHSNADWVVVLNSDTIVSEGWLGRLMNCALTSEMVGMVGPLSNAASWQSIPEIHNKDGDWHLNPLPDGVAVDDIAKMVDMHSVREYPEVGVINGFCQLINMALLDEIGALDEIAFPVGYGEENDMCARAVKAGYKLLIADDTYVFHSKSKSFGHEQRKKLAKQGSVALKKKHPDVDWGEVTKLIRENPALNELRSNISLELKQFINGEV